MTLIHNYIDGNNIILPREVSFSLVTYSRDTTPIAHSATLPDLFALLQSHGRKYTQKDGPAIIGGTFTHAGTRKASAIKQISLLMLDFDGEEGDVAALLGPLKAYQQITYSTYSHGIPGKWEPGKPRFRAVIPLARAISRDEHTLLWGHVNALLGGMIDPACKDAARLMYTPRVRANDSIIDPWIEIVDIGPALDPDALPTLDGRTISCALLAIETDKLERKKTGERDSAAVPPQIAEVGRILSYIDPDAPYHDWLAIGTALKTTYGEGAYSIFADWSAAGKKYPGETELERAWHGFPAARTHTNPITMGTVYYHAREGGYEHEKKNAPAIPAGLETADVTIAHATIQDAREDFARLYREADARGGVTHLRAPVGVGKTSAFLQYAIATPGRTVIACPTNALAKELERALHAIPNTRTIARAEARRDSLDSCAQHIEYMQHARLGPMMGHTYCGACSLRDDCATRGYLSRAQTYATADIVLCTHDMLPAVLRPQDAISVDWRGIAQSWSGGAMMPTLRTTPRGHKITLETHTHGLHIPGPDRWTYEGEVTRTYSPEARETILQTIGDAIFCEPTREAIRDTLRSLSPDDALPLAYIDEAYHGGGRTVTLSPADIASMVHSGELVGDTDKLRGAMEKTARSIQTGDAIQEVDVMKLLKGIHAPLDAACFPRDDDGAIITHYYTGYKTGEGEGEAIRDWRALDALRDAIENGPETLYIAKGLLHLAYRDPLPLVDRTRATIIADATGSAHLAKRIYNAHCVDIKVPPKNLRLLWFPTRHTGKKDIADGRGSSAIGATIYSALHKCFPDALHVTHKRHTDADASGLLKLLEDRGDAITYYGAPDAKGSNAHATRTAAILDAYHVPKYAIEARARLYCAQAGGRWDDEREIYIYIAREQLERAPQIQAAGRIRYLTPDKTLVITGKLPPDAICEDWTDYERINPVEYIARAGIAYHGATGLREGVLEAIDRAPGGILIAGSEKRGNPREYWERRSKQRKPLYIYCDSLPTPSLPVNTPLCDDLARLHFSRDWRAMAKSLDAQYIQLETSLPGPARNVLYRGELTPELLREAITDAGLSPEWIRVPGQSTITLYDRGADYRERVLSLLLPPKTCADLDAMMVEKKHYPTAYAARKARMASKLGDINAIRAYICDNRPGALSGLQVYIERTEDAYDWSLELERMYSCCRHDIEERYKGTNAAELFHWVGRLHADEKEDRLLRTAICVLHYGYNFIYEGMTENDAVYLMMVYHRARGNPITTLARIHAQTGPALPARKYQTLGGRTFIRIAHPLPDNAHPFTTWLHLIDNIKKVSTKTI